MDSHRKTKHAVSLVVWAVFAGNWLNWYSEPRQMGWHLQPTLSVIISMLFYRRQCQGCQLIILARVARPWEIRHIKYCTTSWFLVANRRPVCLVGNRTSPLDNLNDRLKRLCLVSRVTVPCVWMLRLPTKNLAYLLTYLLDLPCYKPVNT